MLSDEDVERIASAVVETAREDVGIRDVIIGSAMGEGAIPLYGRETRKEPCHGCRIDPSKPLEAGNVMATTNNAIGTLARDEVRKWCSEIIEVADGRCERARTIREAARECKEKHPEDTEAFFRCYIPAFSKITKGSNPGGNPKIKYLARLDPALATRASEEKIFDSPDEAIAYAETLKAKMLPGDVVHVREGLGFEFKVIHRYQMPLPTRGGTPAAKELWEMTLEQYALEKGARPAWVKAGYGETYRTHKRAVERAISEGKPVSPEVLADYPDLLKGARR